MSIPYTYDPQANALYVRIAAKPVAGQLHPMPGVLIDYDRLGEVVGIELLLGEGEIPEWLGAQIAAPSPLRSAPIELSAAPVRKALTRWRR